MTITGFNSEDLANQYTGLKVKSDVVPLDFSEGTLANQVVEEVIKRLTNIYDLHLLVKTPELL